MKSRIFFSVFFLLLALAVANTYYHIYVLQDYRAYTEEEEIPEPYDLYLDIYHAATGVFTN